MRPTALVLALVLMPCALALPAPLPGLSDTGVAFQGSRAEHQSGDVCSDALTPYVLTVTLRFGSDSDEVRITAIAVHGDHPTAIATLAKPAVIKFVSSDSCVRYIADGVHVETAALYEARAEFTW